jgi:hypothetical protein
MFLAVAKSDNSARFAVPLMPELFLVAMVLGCCWRIATRLARKSQCAPTARITSAGRYHPVSSRFDLVAGKRNWVG